MEPEQLVLCDITAAYERITKRVNASNFTWLNEYIFNVTRRNNLHSFNARVIWEVYDH